MATENPIVIGYSGSLYFYESGGKAVRRDSFRDWFWTYNYNVTDPSTRSASYLFRALKTLRDAQPVTASDIQIRLWGKIDPRYRKQAEELGIADLVSIEGYLPKEESLKRNASCDLLFLPMESGTAAGNPLFIPGKAYEYMKAAKPVLMLSGPCDCQDILRPSGLLIDFAPQDSAGLSRFLGELIRKREILQQYRPDMNYIEQFSFRNITGKLAGVFDEILSHD